MSNIIPLHTYSNAFYEAINAVESITEPRFLLIHYVLASILLTVVIIASVMIGIN